MRNLAGRTAWAAVLIVLIAACSEAAAEPPSDPADELATAAAAPSDDADTDAAPAVEDDPEPGTELNACQIVTPDDIAAALSIDVADVSEGELELSPTSLSPGHSDCRYRDDAWGGLKVSLTPEDGINLYDAARGAYRDAVDVEVAGADGAFWSADAKRGFFSKGAVTVLLQISHLTTGGDFEAATVSIGQAAMDRID